MEALKKFKRDGCLVEVSPNKAMVNKKPLKQEHLVCKNTNGWLYMIPTGSNPIKGALILAFKVGDVYGLYPYLPNKKGKINPMWMNQFVDLLEQLNPELYLCKEVKQEPFERCIGWLRTDGKGTPLALDHLTWEEKAVLINRVVISVDSEETWVHTQLMSECMSECVYTFVNECKTHIKHLNESRLEPEEELVFDADLFTE